MADAVREEERHGAALDERLAAAAQHAELDEAVRDDERCRAVDVAPLDSRPAGGDRGLAGLPHGVVDERLLGRRTTRRRRTFG